MVLRGAGARGARSADVLTRAAASRRIFASLYAVFSYAGIEAVTRGLKSIALPSPTAARSLQSNLLAALLPGIEYLIRYLR